MFIKLPFETIKFMLDSGIHSLKRTNIECSCEGCDTQKSFKAMLVFLCLSAKDLTHNVDKHPFHRWRDFFNIYPSLWSKDAIKREGEYLENKVGEEKMNEDEYLKLYSLWKQVYDFQEKTKNKILKNIMIDEEDEIYCLEFMCECEYQNHDNLLTSKVHITTNE
jgi:hypothetical protein